MTLLLGGAGAGKSALAVRLASAAAGDSGAVLFVATAQPSDPEMEERIHRHQAARPKHWRLVEEPFDLVRAVEAHAAGCNAVLVDCLTLWVSNLLLRHEGDPAADERILSQTTALLAAWERLDKPWFIVSNEVGMGVVPPSPLGRAYRDVLGKVNRAVAARATKAYFVVAGLALDLNALGTATVAGVEHHNPPFPFREGGQGG
ncbi:MAG: bifunctional adenosylcobinamide kinase/adenosylcobinamide-phosphate guanylyltransferase [Dehalococcoidia bacterium]|nr:bifunctional adenosylcobinamide kinase/adenosylcobinamide-phosphate guanylyltransferase [Dehalococcoidia bacterium]